MSVNRFAAISEIRRQGEPVGFVEGSEQKRSRKGKK